MDILNVMIELNTRFCLEGLGFGSCPRDCSDFQCLLSVCVEEG
jgi:hypothetical protein